MIPCQLKKAQVCHGGVSLKEVDENLQLKKYPGIYVCGEALDVDGDCGGYNLHLLLQVVYMWQNLLEKISSLVILGD